MEEDEDEEDEEVEDDDEAERAATQKANEKLRKKRGNRDGASRVAFERKRVELTIVSARPSLRLELSSRSSCRTSWSVSCASFASRSR